MSLVGEPASSRHPHPFPPGFVWGVATSAYQIEGAAAEDGKGPSIWDRFCREPGRIAGGDTGDVACDHYHRWPEDLDLAAWLGVDAYRFSVSWPRVQPLGYGAWNARGLDFYERLVDGMLARGLRPWLTLNHWDLPQALQDLGGWAARDTAHRFVDYALGVQARLGDRVESITTHNEPWVIGTLGYETGRFAPGLRCRATAMQAVHHLLLSHGLALQALRAAGSGAQLGIVLNLSPVQATTDNEVDLTAARLEDGQGLRWYLDPLFHGAYPVDVLHHLGADAPAVLAGDMADIATAMDFLGVNYYARSVVGASGHADPVARGCPVTAMGWEIYPEGLTELLLRLHRDYAVPPLVVTENGAAFDDVMVDGGVADLDRAAYLAAHIDAAGEACRQGVPLAGFMAWSLLDNFEWASGYAKRFGIVHVDYATQRRTPKHSAHALRDFLLDQRAHRAQQAAAAPVNDSAALPLGV